MSGPAEQITESVPDCPRCGRPMVLRTARRGENAGRAFWGCPEFPRCRGMVQIPPPTDEPVEPVASAAGQVTPAEAEQANAGEATYRGAVGRPGGLLAKFFRAVDRVWRWTLESYEPDATGRWDPGHRRRILSYICVRDSRRCGLCAGEIKNQRGVQIEHIVPKIFAIFDVSEDGRAEQGTRYRSRLHKPDNLQAAHSYCNKRKGNNPAITGWRHPAMPPLTVADAADASPLVLPPRP